MYTVYISHSVRPWELAQVYVLAQETERQGLRSFFPDRTWSPRHGLPSHLADFIQQAQVVLLFATVGGHHQEWVNKEFEVAQGKQVLALVEQGMTIQGIVPANIVEFSRSQDLSEIVNVITQRLAKLRLQKQTGNLVAGLVIGGVVLLLLRGLRGSQ